MNGRTILLTGLLAGLLATVGLPARSTDADQGGSYTLEFEPTQNALPGSSGEMTINPLPNGTFVSFKLRGGYPNTVYTIWTVFNQLVVPLPTDPSSTGVPACPATGGDPNGLGCPSDPRPGFPPEGNGVAPLARLDTPFTDGMGLDQGMTFGTDDSGNGEASITVEYNLLGGQDDDGPPLGNKDVAVQSVCPRDSLAPCKTINVATTWLRKFIGDYPPGQGRLKCANYEAVPVRPGIDPRYWQCVDPATGLPRVPRYAFDHFRLAPHPDGLTHGLFGGNGTDHFIDMVGRRCQISPPIGDPCPPAFP